ncbi:MAG: hypothetical protein Q7R95_04225 [bacterium]|nr:hypothetical protein [bacterium]
MILHPMVNPADFQTFLSKVEQLTQAVDAVKWRGIAYLYNAQNHLPNGFQAIMPSGYNMKEVVRQAGGDSSTDIDLGTLLGVAVILAGGAIVSLGAIKFIETNTKRNNERRRKNKGEPYYPLIVNEGHIPGPKKDNEKSKEKQWKPSGEDEFFNNSNGSNLTSKQIKALQRQVDDENSNLHPVLKVVNVVRSMSDRELTDKNEEIMRLKEERMELVKELARLRKENDKKNRGKITRIEKLIQAKTSFIGPDGEIDMLDIEIGQPN